jgi:hypothetical protein
MATIIQVVADNPVFGRCLRNRLLSGSSMRKNWGITVNILLTVQKRPVSHAVYCVFRMSLTTSTASLNLTGFSDGDRMCLLGGKSKKVKLSPQQAVEAYKVVRC